MEVSIPGRGVLQGAELQDSKSKGLKCYRFSGVPYALPPTGPLRWRKPESLPPSFSYGSESYAGKYTKPSNPCPQLRKYGVTHTNEDCLQLNIWVPKGDSPKGGFPVFFYIHGGFLQFHSNSADQPQYLIDETDVKCIVVAPNYRLGVFGFLASREICEDNSHAANFGFWDQRMALEWTYDSIEYFGGNKQNITVGGLSAGSYSTFHQLAYDIGPNPKQQIIRRVMQWSNGCGVQPKQLAEAQLQFDDFVSTLGIPRSTSATQKMAILRSKSAEELVVAWESMKQIFVRQILDGEFISEDLFRQIYCGEFGRRMEELGIQLLIGDLTQEWHLYKMTHPPNSYESLVNRLNWDYPRHIVEAVCEPYKTHDQSSWLELFGRLYADLQIHSTMRGLLQCIATSMPLDHIHRYRIDWRARCIDKRLPPEFGPTHGTDLAIWFFGNGNDLTDSEKVLVRKWLNPVGAFLRGEKVEWGTKSIQEVKYLTTDGNIEIREDPIWEEKLQLWDLVRRITIPPRIRPKI